MSFPMYLLVGLRLEIIRVLFFILINGMVSIVGVAIGFCIGSLARDYQVPFWIPYFVNLHRRKGANQAIMPSLFPMMIFSGYMIPFFKIPIYFKWIYFVSIFQYGLSLLEINEFSGLILECEADISTCYTSGDQYLASLNLGTDRFQLYLRILFGFMVAGSIGGYYAMRYDIHRLSE